MAHAGRAVVGVSVQPYRCPTCGKLLFKSDADAGRVETYCRPCKVLRSIELKAAPRPLDAGRRRAVECP
jgi:phage FluMu protein Com